MWDGKKLLLQSVHFIFVVICYQRIQDMQHTLYTFTHISDAINLRSRICPKCKSGLSSNSVTGLYCGSIYFVNNIPIINPIITPFPQM